jgi:SAM-dependent methyltransferase
VLVREHWERHAAEWIRWARTPGHDYWYARFNLPRFLELVPPPGRLTIDLGCGEGRLARELDVRGHHVLGVDSAAAMVRAAAKASPAAKIVMADAGRLPLRAGIADLVVAFMSLFNIDDMPGAVREVQRVLVPGGRLCLAVVHPLASTGAFLDDDPDQRFVLTGSYFTPRAEPQVFERNGVSMTFCDRHLPLEAYVGALEDAGLLVEALREPQPDDAAVADHPALARRREVPMFLHVRAVKLPSRPPGESRQGP